MLELTQDSHHYIVILFNLGEGKLERGSTVWDHVVEGRSNAGKHPTSKDGTDQCKTGKKHNRIVLEILKFGVTTVEYSIKPPCISSPTFWRVGSMNTCGILFIKMRKISFLQLDQIRVGEFTLWVNKPRFNEQEKQLRVAQRQKENAGIRGHRTFAEVVKGINGSEAKLESKRAANGAEEHDQTQINNLSKYPKQVWREKDMEQAKASMSFTVQEEEYAWLQGCYVGIAHSVEIIPTLQEKFFMEGYFSCRIRAIGGRLVLLEGGDKEEIKDLVELAPKWLEQWFTEVQRLQGRDLYGFDAKESLHTKNADINPGDGFHLQKYQHLDQRGTYLIKVMEEEAPNGIFSMKSDQVFRELSDSDDGSSESWSLDDDVDEEASVAFLGGGEVNGGWSSTSGKKGDDDMEVEDEMTEEDDRDEQPPYRWSQERQNTNGAQLSAVNDIAFNAADSQDKQQTNEDDKIQICCTSNHEKSIANLEIVPDSQGTQICQNKDWQRKWVTEGPLTMSSPLEDDPLENNDNWATNNHRPPKQDTFKSGSSKPINKEMDSRSRPSGRGSGANLEKSGNGWAKIRGNRNSRRRRKPDPASQCIWREEKRRESVTDSGIENRNVALRNAPDLRIAERIWAFAKEIRVGDHGNEAEVIQKLRDMEERDRELHRTSKVFVVINWCLNWGDVKQWGLKKAMSDHCPILLKNQIIDWGPKPFRFFDVWFDSPGLKELVSETWKSTVISGWHGYRFKEKMKETKKVLKEWSKTMVSETDLIIKKCKDSIADIDIKGETANLNDDDVHLRRSSFLELWKQQKVQEIKEGVANYFKILFTEERWQRPHLDGIEFKKISAEDNSFLLAPFNEEEVKRAVWSCGCSKAPGPDGFNFKFIREMWDTIKDDMMGFVDDFHKNGKLVRGANNSFIVLIPKVMNPQKIEEFRPISLISVMYKVIVKLLANRICSVLDGIIGENQMAFIKGRQMVDSIVIANETINEAKRKKKASFLFKIDFEKVYDKVCWEFLDYMMSRMGFDPKWRRWINECLKTTEASILLNGSTTRQVKINKGLRQGDPLSPYVFLLVAESLNGIISSAINHGLFDGIDIGSKGLKVSHLQFADDSILFGKAGEDNIWATKSILRIFELELPMGGGGSKRKINWVSWDKVCSNKMEGGLGVKDLRKFNLALLGKWWGRLASGEESLLYNTIQHKIDGMDPSNRGWLSWGFKLKLEDRQFLTAHPKTCQEDFEQHRPPIKDSSVQAGWDV
ncbi:hypothetical protein SLEP1_g59830, partial [Rubroshorea leprosula]